MQTQQELVDNQTIRERLLARSRCTAPPSPSCSPPSASTAWLNYSVLQREREIGIRIAVGARVGSIARLERRVMRLLDARVPWGRRWRGWCVLRVRWWEWWEWDLCLGKQ